MIDESEEDPDDELRELLNDALNLHSEELKAFKNSKELRSKLKSIVSEYLDSFYIFGYDINGKTILVKGAHSDQQLDALDALAIRLLMAGSIGPQQQH
jgi:signal transduction histidine kinase